MQWEIVVALAIAVPIILLPVVFVWYLNIDGIYTAIKKARVGQAVRERGEKVAAEVI